MFKIGIIGGSAFYSMANLNIVSREMVSTPYGVPSSPIASGNMNGCEFIFLHRHGFSHTIAPHNINYRANLWALKKIGVTHVIAIAAAGGITEKMSPLMLVLPHQIIDYTHFRLQTFNEDTHSVKYIDFEHPYDEQLRKTLTEAANKSDLSIMPNGVYGATQGPRLETVAEIKKMERDGCDIVGMTGMPEAALARELELKYVCCSVIVNWAAGKNKSHPFSMDEIKKNLKTGMNSVHQLLTETLPMLTT